MLSGMGLLIKTLFPVSYGLAIFFGIALMHFASMDQLVLYAWSGLGASFGPLVIGSLYFKRLTSRASWVGMAMGGGIVALWLLFSIDVEPLIVAFPVALSTIWVISQKQREIVRV